MKKQKEADREQTATEEIQQLRRWVNDLQSGMYINCVYCGHRYGPSGEIPVSMADVLKEHIQQCPKHPMSAMRTTLLNIVGRIEQWQNTDPDCMDDQEQLDTAENTIDDVMKMACAALKEKA